MNFYPLELKRNLYNGYRNCFRYKNINLLLIQDNNTLYLIENRCPHMDWLLDGGRVSNQTITCPKHNINFSLTNGEANAPMRLSPLKIYACIEENEHVGLDTDCIDIID